MIKVVVCGNLGEFRLDASFEVPGKGITALFGRSGCGKTSLLRWIAGLESHSGYLSVNGEVWQDSEKKIFVPSHKRQVGYVFQEPTLFSHLSVVENLKYAFNRQKEKGNLEDIKEVIELLGLKTLLHRTTSALSGGERQRVAIGRALLVKPKLLLLDEPLSALDHQSKQEILPYLERVKNQSNVPVFYVSHSQEEVLRLSDYLVELSEGRVVQNTAISSQLQVFEKNKFISLNVEKASLEKVKALLENDGYVVEIEDLGLRVYKE